MNEGIRQTSSYQKSFYEKYIKRMIDIICSGVALVLLSPVLLLTAVLVRLKLGSPIIFKQERPGRDTKSFYLYKFRSMTDEKDQNGELLPDEMRLTSFGKLLRATSLDELPELWNIFRGDMSIVGPRPLLTSYLPYYRGEETLRHTVRPGLTGLAQINGRNYLMWDDRLALDVCYVKNITFIGDFKIIVKTIEKVIKRSDVAEQRILPLNQVREEERV